MARTAKTAMVIARRVTAGVSDRRGRIRRKLQTRKQLGLGQKLIAAAMG